MNHPMMDTVREYIDAFNEGNVEGMAAQFDASGSILDGIAPRPVARADRRGGLVSGSAEGRPTSRCDAICDNTRRAF